MILVAAPQVNRRRGPRAIDSPERSTGMARAA
jgi:hypothetical protein